MATKSLEASRRVDEGDIDRLREVEAVGRIEKLESFGRCLAVDEEEANGFPCPPVGCPVLFRS
jgi:hypothetical protein